MTYPEILTALEEARSDAKFDAHREGRFGSERVEAELSEWERIAHLLAGSGAPYDPNSDTLAQYEHAEWERIEELRVGRGVGPEPDSDAVALGEIRDGVALEQQAPRTVGDSRQGDKDQDRSAPKPSLAPEVVRHTLLRTLTQTRLLEELTADERSALERLSHTDSSAALAVGGLISRAFAKGQAHRERDEDG